MVDISASKTRDRKALFHILASPVAWLWLSVAALFVLLTLPLAVPIGPMYWDTYIYLDAAQRIRMGQIPSLDFSTPVGALGYYLFTWGLEPSRAPSRFFWSNGHSSRSPHR